MTTSDKYAAMAREVLAQATGFPAGPMRLEVINGIARALERAALEGAIEQLEWTISVVPSEAEHYLRDNVVILRARLVALDKETME